jgi:hypothetical protein
MRSTNVEVIAGEMYVSPINDQSDSVDLCLSARIDSEIIRKNV